MVNQYASYHQILLVGDGDFSFSLCLARSFGSAINIVATSLDSYDAVIDKYKQAKSNIEELKQRGAFLLHEVDAKYMKRHPYLMKRHFDRIIYNFPHAGFYGREDNSDMIRMHQELVNGFFNNAAAMLGLHGEIHVSHKTSPPFSLWDLQGLALRNSLISIGREEFRITDYPGYNNKRGGGLRCDDSFPLGEASTFKFVFCPAVAEKLIRQKRALFFERQSPYLDQLRLTSTTVPFTEVPSSIRQPDHNQCGNGGFLPQIRIDHPPPPYVNRFRRASAFHYKKNML